MRNICDTLADLFHDTQIYFMIWRTAKPAMLITLTTNPRWPEITAALVEVGLGPDDYVHAPDVVVRAFQMRVKILLGDVLHRADFGRVLSWVGVTEFTTSLLPHYHLVVMLHEADKPSIPEKVDAVVSAELPCEEFDREGFNLVQNLMLHRPCDGSSPGYRPACLGRDGKCKHGFPFDLRDETVLTGAKPLLRRRDRPAVWHSKFRCYVDNRWVVPHNLKLLKRLQSLEPTDLRPGHALGLHFGLRAEGGVRAVCAGRHAQIRQKPDGADTALGRGRDVSSTPYAWCI